MPILKYLKPLIALIYPPICMHCQEQTLSSHFPLCPTCTDLMELVAPMGRCERCFEKEEGVRICSTCRKKTPYFHRHFSACDSIGPATTLLIRYKRGDIFLADALSSWMTLQYLTNERPLPDFLVPLRGSLWERLYQGEDLNTVLAQKVGFFLKRPVLPAIQQKWNEEPVQFFLKTPYAQQIMDKNILLISSLFRREEIESAAKTLRSKFPHQIDSLSFI